MSVLFLFLLIWPTNTISFSQQQNTINIYKHIEKSTINTLQNTQTSKTFGKFLMYKHLFTITGKEPCQKISIDCLSAFSTIASAKEEKKRLCLPVSPLPLTRQRFAQNNICTFWQHFALIFKTFPLNYAQVSIARESISLLNAQLFKIRHFRQILTISFISLDCNQIEFILWSKQTQTYDQNRNFNGNFYNNL